MGIHFPSLALYPVSFYFNSIPMSLPRNIAFTSLIKINGRLREFNFRKRADLRYDVDTNDERGNRYFFKMVKQEGAWKVDDTSLPDWLTGNENLIAAAIDREE